MKTGLVGLGIMGSRMAANLQTQGHDLIVYNRARAKADPLIERGATWDSSPAQVGQQVKMLIVTLAIYKFLADEAKPAVRKKRPA